MAREFKWNNCIALCGIFAIISGSIALSDSITKSGLSFVLTYLVFAFFGCLLFLMIVELFAQSYHKKLLRILTNQCDAQRYLQLFTKKTRANELYTLVERARIYLLLGMTACSR